MTNAKDNGTPKLIIETGALFGDKRVEQVKVDSNRLDPIETARSRTIAALIHPYFIDAVGNAVCWVSGIAFLSSMLTHTTWLDPFTIPIALIITVIAFGAMSALFLVPEVGGAIVLHALYVLFGLALGQSL